VEPNDGKRQYPRYNHNSPLSLYRMDHQEQSSIAQMENYSQAGMCLLSHEELVLGQLVYLKMMEFDKHAKGPEKNKSYSGIVKWLNSSPLSHGEKRGLYQYGIEYHNNDNAL